MIKEYASAALYLDIQVHCSEELELFSLKKFEIGTMQLKFRWSKKILFSTHGLDNI